METWQKREKHHKEVKQILEDEKCMDSKGRIRAWKPTTWGKLREIGHTSLDFDKCRCKG